MVGDFNNDGFIDFATGGYNSGTVSILINNSKRRSRPQCLTTVFGYVFVEFVTGFDALIMGLTGDFTQQSKFTLWEQASSDVRHKSHTV
jgi:hypothetical protein